MNERHAYKIPQLNKWGVIDSNALEIEITVDNTGKVSEDLWDIITANPYARYKYNHNYYHFQGTSPLGLALIQSFANITHGAITPEFKLITISVNCDLTEQTISLGEGGGGGGSISIDATLSTTSTNPVQNKVITTALNNKAEKSDLDSLATKNDLNSKADITALQNLSAKDIAYDNSKCSIGIRNSDSYYDPYADKFEDYTAFTSPTTGTTYFEINEQEIINLSGELQYNGTYYKNTGGSLSPIGGGTIIFYGSYNNDNVQDIIDELIPKIDRINMLEDRVSSLVTEDQLSMPLTWHCFIFSKNQDYIYDPEAPAINSEYTAWTNPKTNQTIYLQQGLEEGSFQGTFYSRQESGAPQAIGGGSFNLYCEEAGFITDIVDNTRIKVSDLAGLLDQQKQQSEHYATKNMLRESVLRLNEALTSHGKSKIEANPSILLTTAEGKIYIPYYMEGETIPYYYYSWQPDERIVHWFNIDWDTFTVGDQGEYIVDANADVEALEEITYESLKQKRNNKQLTPGKQYRIIDYVTTTTQENTQSAGHQFDIIVTADDERTLNENARVIAHEGDDYFQEQVEKIVSANFKEGITRNDVQVLYELGDGKELAYETGETNTKVLDLTTFVNEDGIEVPAFRDIDPESDIQFVNHTLPIVARITEGEEDYQDETHRNDVFVELSYNEDRVPMLFKTDLKHIDVKGVQYVDYEDFYLYNGQMEWEGETYDHWIKWEVSSETGELEATQYQILTPIVVNEGKFTITDEELLAGIDIIVEDEGSPVIYYYDGTYEVDGEIFDCWKEDNDDEDNFWRLTNRVVDAEFELGETIIKAQLNAWEIKYCLDNDTTRFGWAKNDKIMQVKDPADSITYFYIRSPQYDSNQGLAWVYVLDSDNLSFSEIKDWTNIDSGDLIFTTTENVSLNESLDMSGDLVTVVDLINEEGKGVIYYMKDEWGNECPYDFKNIQFIRCLNNDGSFNQEHGTDMYCYTFGGKVDRSIYQKGLNIYRSNIIKDYPRGINCGNSFWLPSNVFLGTSECMTKNNVLGHSCSGNTFGDNCQSNVLGDGCVSNIFGSGCFDNLFNNTCCSNTFGEGCMTNIFGNNCQNNTFDYGCNSNIFGNSCCFNVFGNTCYKNTFGNECNSNEFYPACHSNTFGNGCYSNTFGNSCYSNTFGNGCYSNVFDYGCYSNIFDNDCYKNTFGELCRFNSFGNDCFNNTFNYNCASNTFGSHIIHTTFGDDCSFNTFGNYGYANSFKDQCKYNAFGNYCEHTKLGEICQCNSFGDGCYDNKFSNYCCNNTLGNRCNYNTFSENFIYYNELKAGVKYIYLASTSPEASSSNNWLQNIIINPGTYGTYSKRRTITVERNLPYSTTILAPGSKEIILDEEE